MGHIVSSTAIFSCILHLVRSICETADAKMMKLTILALFIACIVGGASAGCYSDWSSCRSACGSGNVYSWGACSGGVQIRPALGVCGGATPCGATPCGGRAVIETRSCGVTTVVQTRTIVIVPSRWTAFSAFGACSVDCGAGIQTRTRSCIKGNHCGAPCVGPASETRACGTPIIHSRLTGFGAFSACSVKCGAGTQTRTRACIAGNRCGKPCVGALTETRACGTPIINSRWSGFSGFSACSVRCGAGTQTRTRTCIRGNSCGAPCVGPASETRACGTPIIPSRWSAFSVWGKCQVTGACGTGVHTRSRTCIRGNSCSGPCVGPATETGPCQVVCQTRVVTEVRHHVVRVGGGCADISGSWKAAGLCGSYSGYMATNCCNSCSGVISSYIKGDPAHEKWTDDMYVEKMNEELKNMKKN